MWLHFGSCKDGASKGFDMNAAMCMLLYCITWAMLANEPFDGYSQPCLSYGDWAGFIAKIPLQWHLTAADPRALQANLSCWQKHTEVYCFEFPMGNIVYSGWWGNYGAGLWLQRCETEPCFRLRLKLPQASQL